MISKTEEGGGPEIPETRKHSEIFKLFLTATSVGRHFATLSVLPEAVFCFAEGQALKRVLQRRLFVSVVIVLLC